MTFKRKLTETDARLALAICTIPSATVPQALAAAGLDAVLIDMEHGAVDYESCHAMIAATAGTECAPLVRVDGLNAAMVKRALDLGAEGICFPLIGTAEQAREAVAMLRYPPHGIRGFGPFIAHSRWGQELQGYRPATEDHIVNIITVETVEAIENIDEIAAVDGIDVLVPAMFDLSTDMGLPGQFDHPDFVAALARAEAAAHKHNIPLANVALAQPQADGLWARGYRVIAGFDVLWLKAKTAEIKSWT